MTQNTSHAVMAQRTHPADSADDFPTQPWGTRALCRHALPLAGITEDAQRGLSVWEPSANRGHMVAPLRESFKAVVGTDLHDYGAGFPTLDFLAPLPADRDAAGAVDLIVTNPPFTLATAFVRRAMRLARVGCAVLVRGTWMETIERYTLFQEIPPTLIAQFAERLPLIEGYISPRASTATSYAWVIFLHGQTDTRWRHIPPCRKALERAEDYPAMDRQARLLTDRQLARLLARHAPGSAAPTMPEAVIRAEIARRAPTQTAEGLAA